MRATATLKLNPSSASVTPPIVPCVARRSARAGADHSAGIAAGFAGASRVTCSRTVLNYPGHLLGTARMGVDPRSSVVDADQQAHAAGVPDGRSGRS